MINQHTIISYFIIKPKAIFLVDSIGAFLSAFCLLIISRFYINYFGINPSILQLLTILPIVFCIFSACCYLLVKRSYKPFIQIIALANLLYGLITLILMGTQFAEITFLGLSYFVLELMILVLIILLEFKIIHDIIPNKV